MHKYLLSIIFIFFLTNMFGQITSSNLQITHLKGNFYIYTTYHLYQGEKISANGMYLVTDKSVVLFDTPWDTTQFQQLLDSIQLKHHKKVALCIATHFHDDRTAGLAYYNQQGIKTFTTVLTDELSKKNNKKRAAYLIKKDTVFKIGKYSFETFYPGQGHSPDNIIIWFKQEKILYGACLIKSFEDEDLGYLGDANKMEYATTIKKVQQKFPYPKYVIVGHGNWSNIKSLKHTRMMAEQLKKKSTR
jgi:metallo-beta-lactamase class B